MSTSVTIVRAPSGRLEAVLVGSAIALIVLGTAGYVQFTGTESEEPRLLDWQVSAFYDLKDADQGIYNALHTASEELWWIYNDLLAFEPDGEHWPPVAELDQLYLLPPFTRDLAWAQQGRVNWERVAVYSFEGATVYHGSGGGLPGQSAYLLVMSHIHKGASYANGATIWLHPDPKAPPPDTIKNDSLIRNGWQQVVPYSGGMEVERLKGG